MIRAFALVLGLWLGLCLALLFGGTLGHLRMLGERTGWALPGWVAGLEDESRFTRGAGTLDGAALSWRLAGWDGFDLRLAGPDWQATARAEPEGTALRIGGLSGTVALPWLGAGPGMLALDGGEALIGLDGTLRSARIDGQAQGAQPEGPVTLVYENGAWAVTSR